MNLYDFTLHNNDYSNYTTDLKINLKKYNDFIPLASIPHLVAPLAGRKNDRALRLLPQNIKDPGYSSIRESLLTNNKNIKGGLDSFISTYSDYMDNNDFLTIINYFSSYSEYQHPYMLLNNHSDISKSSYSSTRCPMTSLSYSFTYSNVRFITFRGGCGIIRNNVFIPIIMLMINKSYVNSFKEATVLGFPMDKSQFEYWVNSETDTLLNTYNLLTKANKIWFSAIKSNPEEIKVVVKKNLTEYYLLAKIPKLQTISERLDWLNSVKNDYLNNINPTTEQLPVKEYQFETIFLEDVSMKFKSKNLNTFVNSKKKEEKKETIKKINKYELV